MTLMKDSSLRINFQTVFIDVNTIHYLFHFLTALAKILKKCNPLLFLYILFSDKVIT